MKNCKYCEAPFEPVNASQQYCTPTCRRSASHREHRDEYNAKARKWKAQNPERAKALVYKQKAKNYRAGKLPPFMFS